MSLGSCTAGIGGSALGWVNPDLSQDLTLLTPDTQSAIKKLMDAAAASGLGLAVRSTTRTCAQQHEQYMIGRGANDSRDTVTGADGCRSWHVVGRAVDFNVDGNRYLDMGLLAESLGFVWGGRWQTPSLPNGDPGHVEWHPGMTIEQVCPDAAACVDMVPTVAEDGFGLNEAVWMAVGIGAGVAVVKWGFK